MRTETIGIITSVVLLVFALLRYLLWRVERKQEKYFSEILADPEAFKEKCRPIYDEQFGREDFPDGKKFMLEDFDVMLDQYIGYLKGGEKIIFNNRYIRDYYNLWKKENNQSTHIKH